MEFNKDPVHYFAEIAPLCIQLAFKEYAMAYKTTINTQSSSRPHIPVAQVQLTFISKLCANSFQEDKLSPMVISRCIYSVICSCDRIMQRSVTGVNEHHQQLMNNEGKNERDHKVHESKQSE